MAGRDRLMTLIARKNSKFSHMPDVRNSKHSDVNTECRVDEYPTLRIRRKYEPMTVQNFFKWFNQKGHTEPLNLQIRQASPQIRRKWQ